LRIPFWGTATEKSQALTTPVATLSMYDWPETAHAIDVLWSHIQNALTKRDIEAPLNLDRSTHPVALWSKPELLIGQTCGWPYANYLAEQVIPFARFDYDLNDCPPGHYNSVYIGHDDDDYDHLSSPQAFQFVEKVAINSDDSQSGFHVFEEITQEPSEKAISRENRVVTGAHRNSISAVANGDANIAAIDSVAFELAKRYAAEDISRIVVLGNSRPKPGLPLITSKEYASIAPLLFQALDEGVREAPMDVLDTLLIKGVVKAKASDYTGFKVQQPQ